MKTLQDYTDEELRDELRRRAQERRKSRKHEIKYIDFEATIIGIDNTQGYKANGDTKYKPFVFWKYKINNRSYEFAEEDPSYAYVTHLYRVYTKLHEHLTPYITELSEEAATTGMPVMRHLVLGWQDDANVYGIDDEYMFGDAFLIAPILKDTDSRDIYLPEGHWRDLNTGTIYSVGKEGKYLTEYAADIATLPSFYNMDTTSEIAPTLVDGIMALYDYAKSVAP